MRANSLILQVTLSCLLMFTAWGKEPMRGPLPAEQRAIIQFLADHHAELKRKVDMRKDGYAATTTTENKELAAKLKEHFAYMHKRLGSGAMVRRWDPAFAEFVEYHDRITTRIEQLENGVRVVVVGKTPEAVKVAQNHARIITGFTKQGAEAVHQEHKPALGEGKGDEKARPRRGR